MPDTQTLDLAVSDSIRTSPAGSSYSSAPERKPRSHTKKIVIAIAIRLSDIEPVSSNSGMPPCSRLP